MRAALASLILASVLSTACSYQHSRDGTAGFLRSTGIVSDYQIRRSAGWVLHNSTRVCLVKAETDGDSEVHRQVHQALARELAQVFLLDEVVEGQSAAWAWERRSVPEVRQPNAEPCHVTLSLRVDRLTEADVAQSNTTLLVLIDIREAASGNLLDHAAIVGQSSVLPLTRDVPPAMVERAMQAYVASISSKV